MGSGRALSHFFTNPPFPYLPAPDPIAAYDMTHDTLGRLATLQQTGAAFSGYAEPTHRKYTHDLRGQITSARSYISRKASRTPEVAVWCAKQNLVPLAR